MVKKHYKKTLDIVEQRRFEFLLLATVVLLVLPAISGTGLISDILFVLSLSFLFIQSMIAANVKKSRSRLVQIIVTLLIIVAWLKPLGLDTVYVDLIKVTAFITFFVFVMIYLVQFITSCSSVNRNVLITAVNIYLLAGIIAAFLAMFIYRVYPNAYQFPVYMKKPGFVQFLYYSFITMSTVGYGDVTPCIPETQTLAYIISISGQLYVAIIIAFLIGKYLANPRE